MRKTLLLCVMTILLTACYHVDVQQGNIIDQNMRSQLHLGMSKNAVNSLLGAPLLSDIFNADIWTYMHTNQVNGGKIESKKLTLRFKNNRLIQITD